MAILAKNPEKFKPIKLATVKWEPIETAKPWYLTASENVFVLPKPKSDKMLCAAARAALSAPSTV